MSKWFRHIWHPVVLIQIARPAGFDGDAVLSVTKQVRQYDIHTVRTRLNTHPSIGLTAMEVFGTLFSLLL